MQIYNLIEYSDDYWETSGSLFQYCKDEPDDNITDSQSFKFKSKHTNNIGTNDTVDVEVAVLFPHARISYFSFYYNGICFILSFYFVSLYS